MRPTIKPPHGRACGERSEELPYACCGFSDAGMPLEYFVVDPAIKWPGKFQRGVKILPRDPKNPDSVNDLLIFVGKVFYPSAWDFVEEARKFGASRKLPPTLPFEKLTPNESRLVFVHSRAIPKFDYRLNQDEKPLFRCKEFQHWVDNQDAYENQVPEKHLDYQLCTHGLRDLTVLIHQEVQPLPKTPEFYQVTLPSLSYQAKYPCLPKPKEAADIQWQVGIFMALPLTHIEFCRKANKKAKEKVEKAGFETIILEH